MESAAYLPIGHHGITGNLHTIALVLMTGSIGSMYFTRFDSPSLFARLPNDEELRL